MSSAVVFFGIGILAIIAILVYLVTRRRQGATLSPLTGVAFAFILFGLFLGENKLLGYSLLGIGMLLAMVDIVQKMKKKQ